MPGRWAHPLFATLVLAAGVAWAIVWEPVPACTAAQPCGADWLFPLHFGLLLLCAYWVWRQPRYALLSIAVLAAISVFRLLDAGTPASGTGESGFLAAAGLVAVTLVHRLSATRGQRALAEEAAGPARHPLPESAGRFARGRMSSVIGVLLLSVTGFALWQAFDVIGAYEERADRATRMTARVLTVEVRDEDLSSMVVEPTGTAGTVETGEPAGDRRYTLETAFPEDYPVGSDVEIVVDGDWVRLVSEPYDIFGWETLLLGSGVLGLAFLVNGLTGRRRSRALDSGRVPVLRVLLREGHEDGRTWVYAADDTVAETPLLTFHSLYATDDDDTDDTAEDEDGRDGAETGTEGDDEDEEAAAEQWRREKEELKAVLKGGGSVPPLREGLLYGPLYTGAEVVFLAPVAERGSGSGADAEPEVEVERSVTPVRAVGQELSGLFGSRGGAGRGDRPPRPADAIAAEMLPSAAPLTWSADGGSRAVGLFLLLVQGGGTWAVLDDGPSWQWLLAVIVVPVLVNAVATALNWRLTADRDGIWVAGPWRVRHIPWDSVIAVRHRPDTIEIEVSGNGADGDLSPVGAHWFQTRLGRTSAALKAAEALRALLHHPELRPEQKAGAAEQGAPLGPVIVVAAAVWAAVVLLLL
ncbi:hypothetical protein BB341_26000 [Streptomyces clavuligerus]|nr:hypothetical protein BB341_26000 [Streptomyces clavuligerus]